MGLVIAKLVPLRRILTCIHKRKIKGLCRLCVNIAYTFLI